MPGQKKTGQEKRGGCICESCPGYNECMRANEDLMFCVKGRTLNCTFDRKGCSCRVCPLHPAENPGATYFCAWGADTRR